jgi:hypothetical protein
MSDQSPRFGLPFILPGQAQKELFHNEALVIIDAAVHPAVEEGPRASPPAAPLAGQSWIVGPGATGAWSGHADSLAVATEGGWRFVAPIPGMSVWDKGAQAPRQWDGAAWGSGRIACSGLRIGGKAVVGERLPTIANPSGGTIIDAEARAALATVIATLKSHGLID